jgi:hypothetical protein
LIIIGTAAAAVRDACGAPRPHRCHCWQDRTSTPRRISLHPRGLALDLRVQFRPGEDDVGGQIEPEQQNDDDRAKRTVGLVVPTVET